MISMDNSSMSRSMEAISIIVFCSTLILFMPMAKSIVIDKISANHKLRDGVSTIESTNGVFELGFFSPGSSKNRYLGIWYKKILNRPVVWVANREAPLADASGVLKVNGDGVLELMEGTDSIVWSSNSTKSEMVSVAQLLDDGNLVIRYENDTDPENFLWESFDHPADNLLPDMKIGWDLKQGFDRYLTSWKSEGDPSPGDYKLKISLDGYPQMLLWKGTNVQFRFGPWDGIQFSGVLFDVPEMGTEVKFVFKPEEIFYIFKVESNSPPMRLMLTPTGEIQVLKWIDQARGWQRYLTAPGPGDICAQYALCGGYGRCSITQPQLGDGVCGCLKGYTPKFPEKWKVGDWTNGCVRKSQLVCGYGDGFVKHSGLKFPDTRRSWFNFTIDHKGCENLCLKNCSCTAYAYIDIRQGGLGCLIWFDDLLDMRDYNGNGLDLYVKVTAAELVANKSSSTTTPVRIIAIALSMVVAVLLGLLLRHACKKKKLRRTGTLLINPEIVPNSRSKKKDLDLPLFDFITIAKATNNFSETNKLGEGGFGSVYKGILEEGQEIAVKRLSKDSRQGVDEFKTEVSCIAELQHRNLVRLLGCCIEEGEMLLVYEYMSNKSLDSIIFDKQLSKSLHWPQRCNIINGIARGILYLHQDSRLRIIHRDLKASNILLDDEMNPRISDFGMARSFGASGRLTNTTRVVGTFGYMAPEYALDGVFSVKSDDYSFGVLVLEIISGKKMRGFYHSDPSLNLVGHAWRLYKEGKLEELIDKEMSEHCNISEVFRAIQIGLLCVQPHPEDRPNMSLVVLMLSSEIDLPEPKQPGFFTERIHIESDSSTSNHLPELFLSNSVSITYIGPR